VVVLRGLQAEVVERVRVERTVVDVTDPWQCANGLNCTAQSTCCAYGTGQYGCCIYSNAVCCGSVAACCPTGFVCELGRARCVRQ
jgi:hypothetical protein